MAQYVEHTMPTDEPQIMDLPIYNPAIYIDQLNNLLYQVWWYGP